VQPFKNSLNKNFKLKREENLITLVLSKVISNLRFLVYLQNEIKGIRPTFKQEEEKLPPPGLTKARSKAFRQKKQRQPGKRYK
jgi:hypothetical protein